MQKKALPSGTRITGHPLAFSIMRICGVDPLAALSRTATWPEGYTPDYVENDGGTLRMRIALDGMHQVLMTINGVEACISARGQALPDTALLSMPGLPLDKVVDHVIFTGAKHRVREATAFHPDEEGVGTHFHLDGEPVEFVVP